jgi:hypothetical protein
VALPSPQTAIAKYGTSDLYYNGSAWVPQYTNAQSKPVSSTTYHATYPTSTSTQTNNPVQQVNTQPSGPSAEEIRVQQEQERVRGEIGSAWDGYLNSLGEQSQYLDQQAASQQGTVNTQYNTGVQTINDQRTKSLRDIGTTTRNAFQAGNNYLGALGAGDSSANNMFKYAIGREALKSTGDLNNHVNSQLNALNAQKESQLQGISLWFSQQQQSLKQAKAQGLLQKGQDLASLSKDLLNQALQAAQQVKTNTINQSNALLQWAANNSTNIGQLQNNIASLSSGYNPGQIQTGGYQVNQGGSIGYGGTTSGDKTDIFGNPI